MFSVLSLRSLDLLWHFRSFFVDFANLLHRIMFSSFVSCLFYFMLPTTSSFTLCLEDFSFYGYFPITSSTFLLSPTILVHSRLISGLVITRVIMFQVRPINLARLALKLLSPLYLFSAINRKFTIREFNQRSIIHSLPLMHKQMGANSFTSSTPYQQSITQTFDFSFKTRFSLAFPGSFPILFNRFLYWKNKFIELCNSFITEKAGKYTMKSTSIHSRN